MSRRVLMFARRTVRDGTRPKLLLAFLVPYVGVAVLLSLVLGDTAPTDLGTAPIFTQEQVLFELYGQLSFVWLVAFPMVLVAVLAATTFAGHLQTGSFRVLLSKPIARWEPLVGTFLGIVFVAFLATLAGLLVGGAALFVTTGASALALRGSVVSLLPGTLAYALVITAFIASVGLLVAVGTGTRLQTALGTALLPALFFAFVFVRVLPVGDLYETLYLYVLDVNYHFGNVYAAIHGAFGTEFTPATRDAFATVSGVYDTTGVWTDPLLGGIASSIPLTGYVPLVLSPAAIAVLSLGALVGAVYRFERMDVP